MGSFVYPPYSLSSIPSAVTITNPDSSQAQFNFEPVEAGTVTDTSTLSGVATIVKTLTVAIKKLMVKNDSGENINLVVTGRPAIVVPKGADWDEFDCLGDIGDTVSLTTFDGAAGGAGEIQISYLG